MTNNQTLLSRSTRYSRSGKASALTPLKCSITLEASLAVPIFVFAAVCLLYLMEIMAVQMAVRSGMQYAAKIIAEESCIVPVVIPSKVEKDMIDAIGTERMERSIIVGGSSGLDCGKSTISAKTGIGELCVEYQIRIPVPVFYLNRITQKETMKVKAWTGYEREGFSLENDEIVYITETGLVYHRDYHCTYLDLSIQLVSKSEIDHLRNSGGEKYERCRYCSGLNSRNVYITDYGNRYHSSLSCSGLKRTVYAVSISEITGRGACSKCGQ